MVPKYVQLQPKSQRIDRRAFVLSRLQSWAPGVVVRRSRRCDRHQQTRGLLVELAHLEVECLDRHLPHDVVRSLLIRPVDNVSRRPLEGEHSPYCRRSVKRTSDFAWIYDSRAKYDQRLLSFADVWASDAWCHVSCRRHQTPLKIVIVFEKLRRQGHRGSFVGRCKKYYNTGTWI